MENNSIEKLKNIYHSVKKLKERAAKLEHENGELRASIFTHLQTIDILRKQLRSENTEAYAAQAAPHLNEDTTALSKELDQYIKLIDKAIAAVQVK
jgi:chromosome segregation ATPase